uniref:Retrovirus-related Pol polyprotein from transposon TNT 1-94 n=1 Tax=Tanacetum cinerariifolium TaxID=118510 RepID=A0A6L2L710_TANCI|nr:retrovirus-related Pol polyprotein from transposon TNT 1-94 [Tanacetum cinerariifolium]
MDDVESEDESVNTLLVSPFLDSYDESDDGEVLHELDEYGNAGIFYRNRIINSLDGEDLAFLLKGLKSTGRNLVAIVRDVYVFVRSFTYATDFVVLEGIEEFIVSDMAYVVMGRPFRAISQLEYDCIKWLISFTRIFYTCIFRMPHTIPRLKNFDWSKEPQVHKMIIKTDSQIVKAKGERRSLALQSKKKASDEECLTSGSKDEEYAMMICLGVDLEPDEWINDSECSKHMTGNQNLFSTYKAYNVSNVFFGSNLCSNIIGQICDHKCRVTLSEHDSEITKNGKVIGRASKELVRNLLKLKFDQHFCDACKIGKQAHTSHKAKNMVLTTRCLELLHMDLFGPSAVQNYRGNRYTLVILDDYSRYTWTRFLKDKTEAVNQFKIFSKKIQNQLGCTMVSIRTDYGREFVNDVQFREFCNANEITHNFSAPRTHQSNSVVERKNKALQGMSRTMLNEQ